MYKLDVIPYLDYAINFYYTNIWMGGKLGFPTWLEKEFGAKILHPYIYFKSESNRNWFALRFS
jgi:hypothetical protein